ncbi:MAG: hypothetical protein ACYDHE_11265 [Candidatus Acidiferrales bacterium]
MWYEGSLEADNRSRYGTNTLLNNALDRAEVGFVHRNGPSELPPDVYGCVVVLHGEHLAHKVPEITNWVNRFAWCLVVIMGDEARLFDSKPFVGPRRKIWRQYPYPGRHDHEDRRLVAGYPADCPAFLEHLTPEIKRKPLNWSYMGQVSNPSRKQCVTILKMLLHGYLYESPGFWQGLARGEYYKKMAESKVVACPAGGAWPESLRVFEALEAGCVPVVEDCLLGGASYWRYVLGEEPPFPTLRHWADFPMRLDEALREWPANRDKLQEWWKSYKLRMPRWFEEDLRAIGAL